MEAEEKPTRPALPPVFFGQFEVVREADGKLCKLGEGGMGTTYKALNRQFRESVPVALKVILLPGAKPGDPTGGNPELLDPYFRDAFRREGDAAASIDHLNVARVHGRGETGQGVVYLAMEFVEGETLTEFLNGHEARRLPASTALAIALQLAWALRAIHGKDIIHRDLKPGNVMLKRDVDVRAYANEIREAGGCLVKVIDFGLAKRMTGGGSEAITVHPRAFVPCTPHYASPEQLAGSRDLRAASDIYSLGVILWEMLVGSTPHAEYSEYTLRSHPEDTRPLPAAALGSLAAPLGRLLRRLLARRPEDRPPDASALIADLEACRDALATDGAARSVAPSAGEMFAGRYQVGRLCARVGDDLLFRAMDGEARVALGWLPAVPPEQTALLRAEWRAVAAHAHAALLVHAEGDLRTDAADAGGPASYAREWAAGVTLFDVLRWRGSLSPAELFRLLSALPGVLDHAAGQGFGLAEVSLRKVFLVRVGTDGGEWTDEQWRAALSQPTATWPDLAVKYNPLGFPPVARPAPSANPSETPTRLTHAGVLVSDDAVRGFASMIRDLLGAPAGSDAPIPALGGDDANDVLRRGLAGKAAGEGRRFGTCQAFWEALRAACGTGHFALPRSDLPRPHGPPRENERKPLKWRLLVTLAAVLLISACIAAALLPRGGNQPASLGEPVRTPPPQATPQVPAPLLTAPYVNSQGMSFVPVPLGNGRSILMACHETRLQDYGFVMGEEAFSDDFVIWGFGGGEWRQMHGSVLTLWHQPMEGIPVTATNVAEAKEFCTTLTLLERARNRLPANWSYRLPRTAEWEAAANPDGSAARYYWGSQWPPPKGSGNYAGTEARDGEWPKNYAVIAQYRDGFPRIAPVGSFPPNALGLYDLDGNVSEWCDEKRTEQEEEYAVRGGSFISGDQTSLSRQYMIWRSEGYRAVNVGFRCVLAPDE